MSDPTERARATPPADDGTGGAKHGRVPSVPPLPEWPRPEFAILEERGDPVGAALWQLRRDVLLWSTVAPGRRGGVFPPRSAESRQAWADALGTEPELAEAGRELLEVSGSPGDAVPERVADACDAVYRWAELRGLHETALQFAEAAAHVEPERSVRSYVAGRLCRLAGEHVRAEQWFRRAVGLARQASRERRTAGLADYARAHLGWGNLDLDCGRLLEADRHFQKATRAALRRGNNGLAAAAHHNMMHVADARRDHGKAMEHGRMALLLYPNKHVRIPNLALDVAFTCVQMGHFWTTISLLEAVRPWFDVQPDRILFLATLARCSAAVGDHARYVGAKAAALQLIERGSRHADSTLYHLAEATRSAGQWEDAEELAQQAISTAEETNNRILVELGHQLLRAVAQRDAGAQNVVPEEGSIAEALAGELLSRLQKLPAPTTVAEMVMFPESYSTHRRQNRGIVPTKPRQSDT